MTPWSAPFLNRVSQVRILPGAPLPGHPCRGHPCRGTPDQAFCCLAARPAGLPWECTLIPTQHCGSREAHQSTTIDALYEATDWVSEKTA
jgi:hypothetical protein